MVHLILRDYCGILSFATSGSSQMCCRHKIFGHITQSNTITSTWEMYHLTLIFCKSEGYTLPIGPFHIFILIFLLCCISYNIYMNIIIHYVWHLNSLLHLGVLNSQNLCIKGLLKLIIYFWSSVIFIIIVCIIFRVKIKN